MGHGMEDVLRQKQGKIITFRPQHGVPICLLNGVAIEHTNHDRYLGIILQSDHKFDMHRANKIADVNYKFGMIRRALHWAPEKTQTQCIQVTLFTSP